MRVPTDIFVSVQWWTDFWTWVNENQLAATVIGGAILLGLGWVASRLPKIGPPVRRFLKWVWSWHPVSARRHTRELDAARKAADAYTQERITGMADVLGGQLITIQGKIQSLEKASAPKSSIKIDLDSNVREKLRAGSASTPAASEPRKIPAPPPRWRVYLPDGEETVHVLENTVDRSVAKEVRLESDGFRFTDGAHWEDLSGKAKGDFSGSVIRDESGFSAVTQFNVSWYDEDSVKRFEPIYLDTSDWNPF